MTPVARGGPVAYDYAPCIAIVPARALGWCAVFRIAAFKPLRYNPEKISFISRVVAPPYDVIDETEAEALRGRDPHNVIRLILGREGEGGRPEGEYEEAAGVLAAWRREDVLIRDAEPSVYVCEQSFTVDGQALVRHGLLCALLLEEFSPGGVLPHEQTFAGPKADRLRLMSACRAVLSPILGVFSDADGQADALISGAAEGPPLYEFRDPDDVAHRVWQVSDQGRIQHLASLLARETLLIADGHHRYEAGLRYRDGHRSADGPPGCAPEDFTALFCVSAKNRGLQSQPTHRLVKAAETFDPEAFVRALHQRFRVTELPIRGPSGLVTAYRRGTDTPGWIGVYISRDRFLLLRPASDDPLADAFPDKPAPWRRLPVTLLHHAILEPLMGVSETDPTRSSRLAFTQNPEHAYWRVESGRYDVGFLLPPITTTAIEEVALAGALMPQKSTFFWPKVPAGFVIYPFEDRNHAPRLPSL